jgi:hypothetical protein
MEVGAVFLLLIVAILAVLLGGAVYAIAARLRGRNLDAGGDRVEGPEGVHEAHARAGHEPRQRARAQSGQPRPEHVEVDSEQRARFIGSR